jgi:Carboxypeptidase regulatory-like domain
MRHWSKILSILVCAISTIGIARAQENAEITGVVTDSTKAAVPNATVTITHVSTGTVRTTQTSGSGLFEFYGLQIGAYDLKATAPGFRTYDTKGIVVNEATTVRADVQLTVGAESQTVTVQANALQVQTETNEVSSLITGDQVLQLSTNGRNVMSLTTLGTGVTNTLPSFNGVTAQGSSAEINFNGSRYDHNNWLIDGGEVYDRGSGGKLDVAISPDALAEFNVLASNYTPDYGINSGGTVAMVLKSGTRAFHGGLWEFNRNDAFDAGYYFFKQQNERTPELRLNIFGGNIGGPVIIPHLYNNTRDKTFFFVNEEWRKFIQGANPSVANTIPAAYFPTAGSPLNYTPLTKNPDGTPITLIVPNTMDPAKLAQYSADGLVAGKPFPSDGAGGYTIPANLLDPNAVLFMGTGAIPKPNTANGTQYIASPKQPTYVREDVVRIDHHFNDKYQLMGHWIHDQMSQTIYPDMWGNDSYVTTGDVFKNPTWGTVIKLTQSISPTLLNETSLNVNGNTINITPVGTYAQPSGWNAVGIFSGNNALNRLPSIDFSGAPNTNWTVNYWPWRNSYLNYQIRDDLSLTKGQHAFRFGFGYMRNDKNQQQQADTQGDYTFSQTAYSQDAYANFLLGFASSYAQLNQQSIFHWVNNTYSMYGQDNWHVLPRLTLNLGLRWDLLPHVFEKNNRTSNFVPSDFNHADAQINSDGTLTYGGAGYSTPPGSSVAFYLNGVQLAGVNGFPRGIVKNSYGTVQPRVGFAYDLFGNGKTVIRGGFGMFFERVQGNDIYGTDTNPPNALQPNVNNVYFSNPNTSNLTGVTSASSALPILPVGFTNLAYYYPNPGTTQFSLGVQHELAPSTILVIQYVGMTAWHQNDERAINTLPLTDLNNAANPYDDREAVSKSQVNANIYRQYLGFGSITQTENITNSNYNSFQAGIRMQNRHGLTVQLSYTLSHEIDIQSGDLTSTNQQNSGGQVSNPFDIEYDRGSGTIDRRNVFTANYIYNLPFFLHSQSALTRSLLGGWQFSGITVAQSGNPVNVTYSPDTLGLGGGTTNRPNLIGARNYPKKQLAWFNTSAFATPTAPWNGGANQGFGTAHKDAIVGPGLFNWNWSLFKNFHLTKGEGPTIQLRAESYNIFNHTEWNNIDTQFTDTNFGQVTSTYDPRTWQFGGKFLF